VVQNRDAARLMGIPITRAIAVAFALSTLLAGVAGVLIAPLFNVNADMGTLFGLKAFAVAILGGITSAWGVMIAGLLFGMAEALITATLGSGYADHHLRAGDRGAGHSSQRPVRPRGGEKGMNRFPIPSPAACRRGARPTWPRGRQDQARPGHTRCAGVFCRGPDRGH
jgi:hypothetical protein